MTLRVLPLLLIALLPACQRGAAPIEASSAGLPPGVLSPAQVQGTGAQSAQVGQTATVEGIVVGNFRRGLGGVFIQSVDADAEAASSEGLFLTWPSDAPFRARVGDRVRAVGTVVEEGRAPATLTALQVSELSTVATGQPLPAPVELTQAPASAAAWEHYEGMRVRINGPLMVSGNDGLYRFGELALAFGGRLYFPTEQQPPGPEAQRIAEDNARRLVLVDDGSQRQRPESLWYLPDAVTQERPLRAGSQVRGVIGVLDQRFGRYRVQLTEALQAIEHALRPGVPQVSGDVRLASFNVLNLFNGDGAGGGFPTERGASTFAAYQRQQAKLVTVVQALQPDIAALMEIENDGFGAESALAQFVDALNARGPATGWTFVPAEVAHAAGPIRVALIYRTTRVTAVGAPAALQASPFGEDSRPPLAQTFQAGTGPRFTVVANHFKSKGSCDRADSGDRDTGDEQGCWNATRVASARALGDWLATDPTASGSDLSVIIGDLNAYSQEDPVRELAARGWRNAAIDGTAPVHSFVFNGSAGRLDHALLSPALAARLRGAAEWHNNSDEPWHFSYQQSEGSDPWRASDHDPLLLGFDLRQ